MSASRLVCSLCRSFLLREEPAPTSLRAGSDKRSREILRLFKLGKSATPEASEGEEEKRELERTRELKKADLLRLPRGRYSGQTVIIPTPKSEKQCVKHIRRLLKSSVLGFDTESLKFNPKKPCLVQLASRDVCILWRLNKSSQFPPILHGILSSPGFLKVGHASEDDARFLLEAFSINSVNVHDTHTLAKSLPASIQPPLLSLRGLVGIFLGQCLSKSMQCSNWNNKKLSWQQLQYASTDAWMSLEVYLALMKYATDNGVSPPPPVECSLNLFKNKQRPVMENKLKKNTAQADDARQCLDVLLQGGSISHEILRNRYTTVSDSVDLHCACSRD